MDKQYVISKSKYLSGLQCPKLLWMSYHAKDKFPPVPEQTQAIFDQGREVGDLAKSLFPGGIEIGGVKDFNQILADTQSALKMGKPLYEAGLTYKSAYARADILVPNRGGTWDLVEVKSSTEAKDINIEDVAFQKYCFEGAGLKLRKIYLMYINNQYVRKGPIDPKELLTQEDVTETAAETSKNVEKRIEAMIAVLNQKTCPDTKIGVHCGDPYDCALKPLCWAFLPEQNVLTLNRINKKKAFELVGSGVLDMKDIKPEYPLSASHRIQREARIANKPHINVEGIRGFLGGLEFPIHFLDFETVGGAIPYYDATRPYQQVPFQFSLHILKGWGKAPDHHGYLADGRNDPRPVFLLKLKELLGKTGTILSYNMSFELCRLRESVEAFPEYEGWFKTIESRFKDLIVPFRSFDYYSPEQLGSASIKSVYPALTGCSYEGLEIGDGGTASLEYARVTFSDSVSEQDRDRVRKGLEEYCKLDTSAMVDILAILKKVSIK